MKTVRIVILALIALLIIKKQGTAQNINWQTLKPEQRHIVNASIGYDYSFTYGVGYGYHLKARLPIVLNIEHSQPAGENVFDDFKTKIGGQVRVYEISNVKFTAKAQGIFRRFENEFVRMLNFGSEMSAVVGYYKPRWYASGEFGFDKAIVTHFKHSDSYRENFPDVRDGWYQPSTGGNFHYGIQAGYSFNNNDITIMAGKVVQQDFKTDPTVPMYFKVGYNRRF